MISFTAYGVPAPKGSTKAFYRPGMRFPVVTEDNTKTRPWAAIVKDAAIMASGSLIGFGKGTPVKLTVLFVMPRPSSLSKRVTHHTKKPDLDKLVRAVKDALTGVLWDDDSQVVEITTAKTYATNGERPRAEIKVNGAVAEARPAETRMGNTLFDPLEAISV